MEVVEVEIESYTNPEKMEGRTEKVKNKPEEKKDNESEIESVEIKEKVKSNSVHFGVLGIVFEVVMLILYCVFAEYNEESEGYAGIYPYYQDVHVMIFIGFGFLMTFLKNYGSSAVSLNFFLSGVAIQWVMLLNSFWKQVVEGEFHKVEIGVVELVEGDFGAAAVLITFGALLGKTTSFQMFIIAICEMLFYSINKMVIETQLQCYDAGGSIIIHLFGAYFGLAASLALKNPEHSNNPNNAATPTSDLFAMIGTVFLWVFWPSFNAALCEPGSIQQHAIVNSLFVLTASVVTAFVMSSLVRPGHKFSMVDVQNATLAGGVAVGSSVSLTVYPGGAIGLGVLAGTLSVVGYVFLTPKLENLFGLHDTCGVNNLHGMPGILGALASAIVVAASGAGSIHGYTAGKQAGIQVAGLFCSLGVSIVGGLITGFVVRPFRPVVRKEHHFIDSANFLQDE